MIINLNKKVPIAFRPVFPANVFTRGRGMIFNSFKDFDAMVFYNCASIHTMLMQINIDVLFIDIENRICDLRKELVPWKLLVRSKKAVTVIELPAGTITRTNTEKGDYLDLNAESAAEEEESKEMIVTPEIVMPMKADIER